MGILLGILKVIGILLLVVLCLVLLILLIVLLVPIRYSLNGAWHESDRHVNAGVTWLLHILSVSLVLSDETGLKPKLTIRIFGHALGSKKNRGQKQKEKRREKRKEQLQKLKEENPEEYERLKAEAEARKKQKEAAFNEQTALPEKTAAQEADVKSPGQKKESASLEKQKEAAASENRQAAASPEPKQAAPPKAELRKEEKSEEKREEEKEKKEFFPLRIAKKIGNILLFVIGKLAYAVNHAWEIPGRIVNAIANVINKAAGICGKIAAWIGFLSDEQVGHTIGELKRTFRLLLRHIGPRRAKGKITFGFEDPSQTGLVLGAASVFFPVYGGKVILNPDFEEKVLDGDLEMRGRIRLGYLVYLALRLILDRDVRGSYQKFKDVREETQNG